MDSKHLQCNVHVNAAGPHDAYRSVPILHHLPKAPIFGNVPGLVNCSHPLGVRRKIRDGSRCEPDTAARYLAPHHGGDRARCRHRSQAPMATVHRGNPHERTGLGGFRALRGPRSHRYPGIQESSADPARVAAQIVFRHRLPRASVILRDGFNIRGLTITASLW